VNGSIGIVFSKEADLLHCSNAQEGDSSELARSVAQTGSFAGIPRREIKCPVGLANGFCGYKFTATPGESFFVSYSIALDTDKNLRQSGDKPSWRVSYEDCLERHRHAWMRERSIGTQIFLPKANLQEIFEANMLALLQLHDKNFVSPGPFLYHHFWFRDAVPILYALDRLGYHKRVRQSINAFTDKMTGDGFLKGPDGEWDSNGEALWLIEKHFQLSPSPLWLKNLYPFIYKAAQWIIKKRSESVDSSSTHRGLMPKSLSAEHFGTVDQYYWDSFWSLAGLQAAAQLASAIGKESDKKYFRSQAECFERDIVRSIQKTSARLGEELIPTAPFRPFDEAAVGSLAGIYPLQIHAFAKRQFTNTTTTLDARFVDENGFYHPFIHSGYNPYLTLHIAHSYLLLGNTRRAWEIAETVFRRCTPPYSLPEAIHPKTGGGAMGDGHHGWAAAEIILFLLDAFIHENNTGIHLFEWCTDSFWTTNGLLDLHALGSTIGPMDIRVEHEQKDLVWCTLNAPEAEKEVFIHFPFTTRRITVSVPGCLLEILQNEKTTAARCRSGYFTLKIEL
jgi:GH15 family glucan-1,4-alpha-glucosidase